MRASDEFDDLHFLARGEFLDRLEEIDPSLRREWSTLTDITMPLIEALADAKLSQLVESQQLPESFLQAVRWDLLHLALTEGYAEVLTHPFYAQQGKHYLDGRFPCGWEGSWPEGKFIVF